MPPPGGGGGRGGGRGDSSGFWEGAPDDDDRRGMGKLRRGAAAGGGGAGAGFGFGFGGGGRGEGGDRPGWRRYLNWKVITGVLGLATLGFFTLVGVAYALTPVPSAPSSSDVTKTAVIFYYADGKREIGRIGKNRELVTLDKVPKHVQEAVIAAENRSFRTDSGFSPKGFSRAVWVTLTGGDTQGGSTITQQLAKNYYLTDERTLTRKVKELFISLKLEDQLGSKDKILEQYLNTIFFGRNSYGIQAASKSFFGKDVSRLNPGEGALLAAIIQQPGKFDPASDNPEYVKQTTARYQYVLNGMRETGALSAADFQKYNAQLPKTVSPGSTQTYGGQKGYMIRRAITELERQGVTEKMLLDQGLRVVTTFNYTKMKYAQLAVAKTLPASPAKLLKSNIRTGMASVNTGNGEVEAIYGGADYLRQEFDSVWKGSAQAGSAMKPYVLATALQKGYNLRSTVEARSGVRFDGSGNVASPNDPNALAPIGNSHRGGPPAVDLVTATKESTNTAFVQLALKMGIPEVVKNAKAAGISSDMFEKNESRAGIALGINDIRPIEQAAGYSVFANGGTYYQPHVVRKVLTKDGKAEFKKLEWQKTEGVFSTNVTRDVNYALQQVTKAGGTAPSAALPDRPVAGKTGTTEKNVATWFVGYIPKMATSVTLYNGDKKTLSLDGQSEIVGGGLTAKIWNAYMKAATQNTPPEQFAPPAYGGNVQHWATPPKKKEEERPERDDDRPAYCNNPRFKDFPQCQTDDGQDQDQGDLPPCTSPIIQTNCDPNKPPEENPPDNGWWCQQHRNDPLCKNDDQNDGGGGGGDNPDGPQQPQRQTVTRSRE